MMKETAWEEELRQTFERGFALARSLDFFSVKSNQYFPQRSSIHDRITRKEDCELPQLLVMALHQQFPRLLLPFATASPITISPLRARTAPLLGHILQPILQLSVTMSTVTRFDFPSILAGLWESILRAVPKKKTSHRKKRQRFMAGKALKDVTALNKCSACGNVKRAHLLCPFCVNGSYQPSWILGLC